MLMNIYHWEKTTNIYIGCSEALESPLESGVYLIPANATSTPIPDNAIINENQIIIWNEAENNWEVKENDINLPEDDTENSLSCEDLLRCVRDLLLDDVDWVVIKYYSTATPLPENIANYMQELRDLPSISTPKKNPDGTLDMSSVTFPIRPDIVKNNELIYQIK